MAETLLDALVWLHGLIPVERIWFGWVRGDWIVHVLIPFALVRLGRRFGRGPGATRLAVALILLKEAVDLTRMGLTYLVRLPTIGPDRVLAYRRWVGRHLLDTAFDLVLGFAGVALATRDCPPTPPLLRSAEAPPDDPR